jgi:hypothetical protein
MGMEATEIMVTAGAATKKRVFEEIAKLEDCCVCRGEEVYGRPINPVVYPSPFSDHQCVTLLSVAYYSFILYSYNGNSIVKVKLFVRLNN